MKLYGLRKHLCNVGRDKAGAPKRMYEEITPEEFVQGQQQSELWQLVDVREDWEREIAAVGDSINIPMGDIPERFGDLDKKRPVAVMCHSGARSARVAAFLSQQGFERVANLSGGIDAWSQTVDPDIPRY